MESKTSSSFGSINDDSLVIIDGVPRVTTDGSPHEILTLVACISGLIVAIIVFVIILLTLREQEQMETHPMACKRSLGDDVEAQSRPKDQQKVTVFTIFGSSKKSFDVTG